MSANPPTSAKIEDLKARVRLDPKSRMFYPLGEELRKIGRLDEAEKVLRDGLEHHGTYLSAWMSLGRVLVEKKQHREATEVLMKALAIDPGNVVCARLLAESYLELGDKLEAVKKLKLVRALLPADEEVDEQIAALESDLGQAAPRPAPASAPAPEPEPEPEPIQTTERDHPFAAEAPPEPVWSAAAEAAALDQVPEQPVDEKRELALPHSKEESEEEPPVVEEEEPFGAPEEEAGAGEAEPEPQGDFGTDEVAPPAGTDDRTATLTMADLYARQGHEDAAREIYLRILDREPDNDDVRARLEALGSTRGAAQQRRGKAERLGRWLEKVSRREL
ncbi:MAG: tetratricopeptide repeat protein [Thermoanaerobaculia bacterium]